MQWTRTLEEFIDIRLRDRSHHYHNSYIAMGDAGGDGLSGHLLTTAHGTPPVLVAARGAISGILMAINDHLPLYGATLVALTNTIKERRQALNQPMPRAAGTAALSHPPTDKPGAPYAPPPLPNYVYDPAAMDLYLAWLLLAETCRHFGRTVAGGAAAAEEGPEKYRQLFLAEVAAVLPMLLATCMPYPLVAYPATIISLARAHPATNNSLMRLVHSIITIMPPPAGQRFYSLPDSSDHEAHNPYCFLQGSATDSDARPNALANNTKDSLDDYEQGDYEGYFNIFLNDEEIAEKTHWRKREAEFKHIMKGLMHKGSSSNDTNTVNEMMASLLISAFEDLFAVYPVRVFNAAVEYKDMYYSLIKLLFFQPQGYDDPGRTKAGMSARPIFDFNTMQLTHNALEAQRREVRAKMELVQQQFSERIKDISVDGPNDDAKGTTGATAADGRNTIEGGGATAIRALLSRLNNADNDDLICPCCRAPCPTPPLLSQHFFKRHQQYRAFFQVVAHVHLSSQPTTQAASLRPRKKVKRATFKDRNYQDTMNSKAKTVAESNISNNVAIATKHNITLSNLNATTTKTQIVSRLLNAKPQQFIAYQGAQATLTHSILAITEEAEVRRQRREKRRRREAMKRQREIEGLEDISNETSTDDTTSEEKDSDQEREELNALVTDTLKECDVGITIGPYGRVALA